MLLGRVLIGFIFVFGGYEKAMHADRVIPYIAHAGLPVPTIGFGVAVFVALVVGLAVLCGLFTRASGLILAIWCVVTALIYHTDFTVAANWIQLQKNVTMAGGLLYVVAFGAGAYSIDALLSRRRIGALRSV